MSQVIIYKQDSGVIAVINPTDEALQSIGIVAIAQKDVPVGKPYKIVMETDIPTDRTERNQWTVADDDLTDGIGSVSNEFGVAL